MKLEAEATATPERIQAALDDLERRGIVEVVRDAEGRKVYKFPKDAQESCRMLRESQGRPQ